MTQGEAFPDLLRFKLAFVIFSIIDMTGIQMARNIVAPTLGISRAGRW